ncbi:hypothetical protein GCM10010211_15420 [Streptomyces albospinus]|uniref:Transcription regulator PadR N-terminal domain-containing protein n=1 Tax=Streptomyces albospinus TaxID=285515 RepID=A0ABQ2USV7_9ACTN|nr:PadR family transcriptional regulator [Streptomyces albospinus]GGU51952.1 hypothetical protein GCM10010211_15420 [Streptomyces albospinus]
MSTPSRSSPLALTVLALLHFQPLHPYGIQRWVKQWGKDRVVNVGQRASLYRTVDRLLATGLVAVRETGRDQQYPERTVYELTDAGRSAMRVWLHEMLAAPKQEFPQFPAALSFVLMLAPEEALDVLELRAAALAQTVDAHDSSLAEQTEVHGLPRVTTLEEEYLRAMTAAELDWIRAVTDDLRSGRLGWTLDEPTGLARNTGRRALAGQTPSKPDHDLQRPRAVHHSERPGHGPGRSVFPGRLPPSPPGRQAPPRSPPAMAGAGHERASPEAAASAGRWGSSLAPSIERCHPAPRSRTADAARGCGHHRRDDRWARPDLGPGLLRAQGRGVRGAAVRGGGCAGADRSGLLRRRPLPAGPARAPAGSTEWPR